jgi:TRAP-type uncharacterized transport system substrate-binding protein
MDLLGSGTRFLGKIVLATYGLTDINFISVNGTSGRAAAQMSKDEWDAFIVVSGARARAVTVLTRGSVETMIGFGEEQKKAILADHLFQPINDLGRYLFGRERGFDCRRWRSMADLGGYL